MNGQCEDCILAHNAKLNTPVTFGAEALRVSPPISRTCQEGVEQECEPRPLAGPKLKASKANLGVSLYLSLGHGGGCGSRPRPGAKKGVSK